MKITLTQIGVPKQVQTKFGMKEKNYVKAQEYGDKFLNYWLGESTKSWAVGQVIEVENVESRDYTATDGSLKTSWDIKLPRSGFGEILKRIEKLENDFAKFKLEMAKPKEDPDYPEFAGQPDFDPKEEVPF